MLLQMHNESECALLHINAAVWRLLMLLPRHNLGQTLVLLLRLSVHDTDIPRR